MAIGRHILLYFGSASAVSRKYATLAKPLVSTTYDSQFYTKDGTTRSILNIDEKKLLEANSIANHTDLLVNTINRTEVNNSLLKSATSNTFNTNDTEHTSKSSTKHQDSNNIFIRDRPFSKVDTEDDLSSIALDTYPNPLFALSKEQIIALKLRELTHLVKIPCKYVKEQDQFCINIIDIANENVLQDPYLVAKLLVNIKHFSTYDSIIQTLVKGFENDKLKLSVLNFIVSPTSSKFTSGFFHNVSTILRITDKPADEKAQILILYFSKLALTNQVNSRPLILTKLMYTRIMKLVGPARFSELYLYFVALNIQTEDLLLIKSLKKTLANGSEIDKFIARTGWIKPLWHDVLKSDFSEVQRQRMVLFFSVDDLKTFCDEAIKSHSVINSNFYMELVVEKFENKCVLVSRPDYKPLENDSKIQDDVSTVLQAVLNHVMEFKDPKNCVPVLKYMVKNQLDVSFPTLLIVMKQLRKKGTFEDALLVMNNINLENLSIYERKALVHEVLLLIKTRYPTSPKILIGYCASIFSGEDNHGVKLLNDLQLLGITHGNGELGPISNLNSVQKANLDPKLTGFHFTHTALANVYESILSSIPKTELTGDLIYSMYECYIAKINSEDFIDKNDRVVNKFINFLLRKNPGKIEYSFYKSSARYEIAKKIFSDFNDKIWLNRVQRTSSLFDLLIHVGLTYHNDYPFALEVIKLSRKLHIPATFGLIYPFIQFHYNREEYKYAELWYNELTKLGAQTTARASKDLFKIARELNWNVSGFVYRKLNIEKNYKTKHEMLKLDSDPIKFINDQNTEDRITEELISGTSEFNDTKFSNELAAILNSSK